MSYMFEVYYRAPVDHARESLLIAKTADLGGSLTYREIPAEGDVSQAVCLTFEFPDLQAAEIAARSLQSLGEHVEGPTDYGD